MKAGLNTIRSELIGLFVDDGALALLAVIWIAAVGCVIWALGSNAQPHWMFALVFFLGLGGLLLESVLRLARRKSDIGD